MADDSSLGRCVRAVGHRPYLSPNNILKLSLAALTNVFSPPRLASLVTAVPYVVRARFPYRNGTRCVSSVCVFIHYRLLTRTHLSAPRLRHPFLNSCLTGRTDDGLFFQYYAIATGTILFYDHFLTLSSEVCRDCCSSILGLGTETTHD